jgi:hypothetical protein
MKSGMRMNVMPRVRMLKIVTTKLMAPASVDSDSRCSERIQRSTPLPGLNSDSESGGYPVQRVQLRERHVPRADHERHEVVAEAGEDRHDDEEDHCRAVHGEELVVAIPGDDVLLGGCQLEADQERQETCDREEHEARDDVEDPDPLVIRRRQPARDASLLPVERRRAGFLRGRHG